MSLLQGVKAAETIDCVIANGTSLSRAIDITGAVTLQVQMPAAWNAAAFTFQVSADGLTFVELVDAAGAAVTVATPTVSTAVQLPAACAAAQYLKIRSGTLGAPVNQGAERVLKVVAKN